MVSAVVAACAVLAACGSTLLAVRRANARSDRRVAEAMRRIDTHLEAISSSVAQALDAAALASRPLQGVLSLDFDTMLDQVVSAAAERTRADAIVVRIEGPRGRPVVRSIGEGAEHDALADSYGPPGGRPFGTAVVDWAYPPTTGNETTFGSALVTPLAHAGIEGTLAAYSYARHAFGPEHAAAIRALLDELVVPLANARRFAEVEARINTDPATGVLNRRGYEIELGRETASARRTGSPLSVVVVGVVEDATPAAALDELAQLVRGAARSNDIPCLRTDDEVAVLLPETPRVGAQALSKRLEAAVGQAFGARSSSVAVGLVESLPHESAEALDARIATTLRPKRLPTLAVLEDSRTASTADATTVHAAYSGRSDATPPDTSLLRADTVESLAAQLVETRRFGRSLALVVLEVEGLDEIADADGLEAATARLGHVAGRIDRSLGTGSAHRLASGQFALVLPGSGIDEAETLVDALQSSLEPPYDEGGVVLNAGITEAAEDEDAQTALGRAEHALWQARQAGPGTVVVAVPSRRPAPPG
jgi:GGDEF domain-containing protein